MYRPSRDESEELIDKLVQQYPKCFFLDPKQRVPLKKNITADLMAAGFEATSEQIKHAVDWYQSHFGYLYQLEAGAKRIDLHGKVAGTVTEQEQSAAYKRIEDGKLKQRERNSQIEGFTTTRPIGTPAPTPYTSMVSASDSHLSFSVLHEAIEAAQQVGSNNPTLRHAMMTAALQIVISEAQNIIAQLNEHAERKDKR